MDRTGKIFSELSREGFGLEIGPSFRPIAAKRAGFNVETVDHMDRTALVAKYRDHGVDIDAIEEVDYVWRGEPLSELIGKKERYDWIIASHVIEHVPDLVGFLNECETLLKPEGILSLVVPDKRYCFDYLRWPTSVGEVMQASLEKRTMHPPGKIFDYFSQVVSVGGNIAWSAGTMGHVNHVHDMAFARQKFEASRASSEYIDIHTWVFTPSSFRLMMQDLREMNLISFSERGFFDTDGCEFYVSLDRGQRSPHFSRLELGRRVLGELSGFAAD
jgi:predicted SAM-dependent methyltransferase